VRPEQAADLLPLFLRNKAEKEEIREISLWDQWMVLALLLIVLSAEWAIRRGTGLP
jgi:hypothetical protein